MKDEILVWGMNIWVADNVSLTDIETTEGEIRVFFHSGAGNQKFRLDTVTLRCPLSISLKI